MGCDVFCIYQRNECPNLILNKINITRYNHGKIRKDNRVCSWRDHTWLGVSYNHLLVSKQIHLMGDYTWNIQLVLCDLLRIGLLKKRE